MNSVSPPNARPSAFSVTTRNLISARLLPMKTTSSLQRTVYGNNTLIYSPVARKTQIFLLLNSHSGQLYQNAGHLTNFYGQKVSGNFKSLSLPSLNNKRKKFNYQLKITHTHDSLKQLARGVCVCVCVCVCVWRLLSSPLSFLLRPALLASPSKALCRWRVGWSVCVFLPYYPHLLRYNPCTKICLFKGYN